MNLSDVCLTCNGNKLVSAVANPYSPSVSLGTKTCPDCNGTGRKSSNQTDNFEAKNGNKESSDAIKTSGRKSEPTKKEWTTICSDHKAYPCPNCVMTLVESEPVRELEQFSSTVQVDPTPDLDEILEDLVSAVHVFNASVANGEPMTENLHARFDTAKQAIQALMAEEAAAHLRAARAAFDRMEEANSPSLSWTHWKKIRKVISNEIEAVTGGRI